MATYNPENFMTRSGKTIVFRHCQPRDIDVFLEFQSKIASETTHTMQVTGRVQDRSKISDAWENNIKDPISLRLGAFVEDQLVGQLGFYSEHSPRHPWTLHLGRFGMMVLKEFWSEGIGRRLLEIMEHHARSVGIGRIEALVRTRNDRGVKLYNRMGYEIEGTRRNAAYINSEFHDEYFIAKILDNNALWVPPVLESERMILRPLKIENADSIFDYAKNPNVSQFTLWEPHITIKDSESFVLDYAIPNYRKKIPEPWAITLRKEPDKVIGTVGCFWVSKAASCMELAYAISESHWGKGFVAEASNPVLQYCFKEFNLNRIQARCKAENKASARVMEKLEMKFEGTLHSAIFHRNRHWDMHYYAALRKEWVY